MTSISVIPDLTDALVTRAGVLFGTGAAATVNVYDGVGVAGEVGQKLLMIGVDDPDSPSRTPSVEASQDWALAAGRSRNEEGAIWCVASAWVGEVDAKAARDAAFSICNALAADLRADPSVGGVASLLWAAYGGQVRVEQAQSTAGAACLVIFQIGFRARLR